MASVIKQVTVSADAYVLGQIAINNNLTDELPHTEETDTMDLQKQAYEQGYLDGKNEAEKLAIQEYSALKQHLQALISSIPDAIAKHRLGLNVEIAEIVAMISQQLFLEKQTSSDALTQQINQILLQINSKESLELQLHPQDLNALQKGTIQLSTNLSHKLTVKANPNLVLGGCLVKTEHGLFDGSIEKQIDKLKQVLIQIRQTGQHANLD